MYVFMNTLLSASIINILLLLCSINFLSYHPSSSTGKNVVSYPHTHLLIEHICESKDSILEDVYTTINV